MTELAEVWFHLLLMLSVGTICEPLLRLICLLFESLRQFLVTRRDCAQYIASPRVAHGFGFGQNFLGTRPQVAGTRQKLQIRHFARPPNSHTPAAHYQLLGRGETILRAKSV